MSSRGVTSNFSVTNEFPVANYTYRCQRQRQRGKEREEEEEERMEEEEEEKEHHFYPLFNKHNAPSKVSFQLSMPIEAR